MSSLRRFRAIPILALILALLILPAFSIAMAQSPKYVFLFIGDGVSIPQVSAAQMYLGSLESKTPNPKTLNFTKFPVFGMMTTHAADSYITDSASAITAMAAGHKTSDGVINMDPEKKVKYKTIAEFAKDKGMKIGIISSVSIDHATPAGFYARNPSRNNYYEIALDLANSGFDFFGGGGFRQPKGKDGKQRDIREILKEKGYKVVEKADEIRALKSEDGKVVAINPVLDREAALPYAINRKNGMDIGVSLAEFTKKAIEMLNNPNGFFIMVEGGKVDWACHANDAASAVYDLLDFESAIAEALKFYEKYPNETLIIVTGDHECGGMSMGFAGTRYETYLKILEKQKISYDEFTKLVSKYREQTPKDKAKLEDLLPEIEKLFGLRLLTPEERKALEEKAKSGDINAAMELHLALTEDEINELRKAFSMSMLPREERPKDEITYRLYGGYEPLAVKVTHILNQKAGIGWTSYSHTALPVPVYAIGFGAEEFKGYYDNTDLFYKMCKVMKIDISKGNIISILPVRYVEALAA
ncbi:MAG: alkaline phosphatase [Synergistetes bacterium]|nr:alkaline phosphatase [Synergistota bacterium]MDW8191722.1 alkaline phosphatase [Synergistota bacterium]